MDRSEYVKIVQNNLSKYMKLPCVHFDNHNHLYWDTHVHKLCTKMRSTLTTCANKTKYILPLQGKPDSYKPPLTMQVCCVGEIVETSF